MHTPNNHPWAHEPRRPDKTQELTRHNMEVAGLVVYFFVLAMLLTIVTIMMLFGTGVVVDAKASMQKNLEVGSKLPESAWTQASNLSALRAGRDIDFSSVTCRVQALRT
jgi:hypothetical protein